MKIGITGGIGSGKSYVCNILYKRGVEVYDCDSAAKRLLRTSDELKCKMMSLVGSDVYDESGNLNKKMVTEFLLASEENTRRIDALVHPVVAEDYKKSGCPWMECAIMYESGFDKLVDRVICVTAPEEVRVKRIMKRDGISEGKALSWISKQWKQEDVQKMSDYTIVNDGVADIDAQLNRILIDIKSNQ